MKPLKLYSSEGKPIVKKVEFANSFFARLKGLMFRKSLEQGTGLLLYPVRRFIRIL